jgi:hypothetical protein
MVQSVTFVEVQEHFLEKGLLLSLFIEKAPSLWVYYNLIGNKEIIIYFWWHKLLA